MASPPSPPLPVPLLRPDRPPVLLVEPGGDPARWAARHRDALRALVTEHGALLVRGLGLRDAAGTAAVFAALSDDLMAETESFAPRRARATGTYTTTPWPPNQQMCPHHELSYAMEFPGLMFFACLRAPDDGGATAVADASAVLDALPRRLVRRFARQGWLLTRTYNGEIGASVAEAFGTDDRAAVEHHCRTHAIAYRWQPDGTLCTRQRRSAVVRHPATGRRCWFNQVAFLNEWTLAPDIRAYLVDSYGPDGLPFNTRYGNGDPRTGDRRAAQRRLPGPHPPHTVALGRPAARRQHPYRTRPGTVPRTPRNPGRPRRPGIPDRLLAHHRGDRRMTITPHPTAPTPSFAVIPGNQVQRALTGRAREIVDLVEATYRLHGDGNSVNPPSYFLKFPDRPTSRIIALPASLGGGSPVDGMKWISSFPANVGAGIPRASAVLILNDHDTGYPFACLESSIISATRTAASAALAADRLSRGRPRPRRIGFFGTGLIARYIHTYLAETGWEFDHIGVHDLSPNSAAGFRLYLEQSGAGPVTVHHGAEDLIRTSDLVVFATVAGQPHVDDVSWFDHHPLVLHISLRDLAPEIVLSAANIVDDIEHCLKAATSRTSPNSAPADATSSPAPSTTSRRAG